VVALRDARPDETGVLAELDAAATRTFAEVGIDLPVEDGRFDGDIVVLAESGGSPVGFAVATRHGSWWHLDQVSVHPDHGRRGVGTALVEEVLDRARRSGADGVTLTTFRDVEFNGPWYSRLGFVETDEAVLPWLAAARSDERARGIDVAPRCAMLLRLL
jgi:GNAT superfamily N-acetyltransferase